MRNDTVAFGIGSNLNNPVENLRAALNLIKQSSLFKVLNVSSIYESDAQLPENSPADWNHQYLNAVILCQIDPSISAENLLHEIKSIELKMGRQKADRWAPRLIDIDILYWSRENYSSKELSIPHSKLAERPFALLPLLEVVKDVKIQRPHWANAYVQQMPFNTKRSSKYVWPKMVGILNITKDSFSDGGLFLNAGSLQRQYDKLLDQGADIIDIGAESTRPGAITVTEDQENEKIAWALDILKPKLPISLDCRHPNVVKKILEKFNISYLNDVSGFSDGQMMNFLKNSELKAFVMHSLSVPPKSDLILDESINPCQQLSFWWNKKQEALNNAGISSDRLIFDPGIGFGKSPHQNTYILNYLDKLSEIKNPIMVGHSRKSFLGLFSDRSADQRDLETALFTKNLNLAFVQYLRVHDIESQLIALRMGHNQ